jgi:hypothetical protein
MIKAGDIYYLPPNMADKRVAGHNVVVLYANPAEKIVYFQTFQSGIFKIFKNFGILNQNGCANCPTHKKAADFRKYLSKKASYLNIDEVIFLNSENYFFLNRETFVCYKDLIKNIYFDFEQKVTSGVYRFRASFFDVNVRQTAVAIRYSRFLSKKDKVSIIDSLI